MVPMRSVADAFTQARTHAVRHMAACDNAQLRWSETSITETVIAHAAQAVTVVPFTQPAEARSGADWIWWRVDDTGAYGMLVQAKRVKITDGTWHFDFEYRTRSTQRLQRDVLRETAEELGVLPVYALYLGTGDYRDWYRCSVDHQSGHCPGCEKRSISLMPEILACSLINDAGSTYASSVALEEIWTPSTDVLWLSPGLKIQLSPELSEFLRTPQDGVRAITRSMIDRVLQKRSGMFAALSPHIATTRLGEHDQLGPVFTDVPDDTGHFGRPYFEHVLTPLLHAPPAYVMDIIADEIDEAALAATMPDNIAGVLVMHPPDAGQ